jgi:hypothetical protein
MTEVAGFGEEVEMKAAGAARRIETGAVVDAVQLGQCY